MRRDTPCIENLLKLFISAQNRLDRIWRDSLFLFFFKLLFSLFSLFCHPGLRQVCCMQSYRRRQTASTAFWDLCSLSPCFLSCQGKPSAMSRHTSFKNSNVRMNSSLEWSENKIASNKDEQAKSRRREGQPVPGGGEPLQDSQTLSLLLFFSALPEH